MQRGVRIGLDIGSVRIGVAYSDPDGIMAMPVATVEAGSNALPDIENLIREYSAAVVYVGNPVNLAGQSTMSTAAAHKFAGQLASNLSSAIEVRLVDERLSTVSAQRGMQAAGKSVKASRSVIDQAAAVIILEQALEIEKKSEGRAGQLVGVDHG